VGAFKGIEKLWTINRESPNRLNCKRRWAQLVRGKIKGYHPVPNILLLPPVKDPRRDTTRSKRERNHWIGTKIASGRDLRDGGKSHKTLHRCIVYRF